MTLTWPTSTKRDTIDREIIESRFNPFGIATYTTNNTITDFVGREAELIQFKDMIHQMFINGVCRAIRLEGPAGVGKSTLFNYLKQSIEEERSDPSQQIKFLLENCDIFSTYVKKMEQVAEFSDLWRPMMEGLKAGFDKEIGYEISLPEYIIYQLIYELLKIDPETLQKIIWLDEFPPKDLRMVKIRDIIDALEENTLKKITQLQDYWKTHRRDIREKFRRKINGQKYEFTRQDFKTIPELFRVINIDDPDDHLELILKADPSLFPSNTAIIEFFNSVMRFYTCITGKIPVFLIGMDEIAKADKITGDEYYHMLGNLFVNLRDSLNYVLFVFISTTEDWVNYDKALNKTSDLLNQISGFMYRMTLKQLSPDDIIQVFRNRMNGFWRHYSPLRPSEAPSYPFNDKLFGYAFRKHRRDLRKTILFLKQYWLDLKVKRNIPVLHSAFDCVREVYRIRGETINPEKWEKSEWDIIRSEFESSSEYHNNSARSSVIESGLEYAWKALQQDDQFDISSVRNNPTIKTSAGKNRRPDILIEFRANLGAELRRAVEFQVKAYNENNTIDRKHIESSMELFEENYSDMVYFIILGKGLSSTADKLVREWEIHYKNRFIRNPLNLKQENHLFLLVLFEKLYGCKIHENPVHLPFAKYLLTVILGQNIENFIADVKGLAFRGERLTLPSSEPTAASFEYQPPKIPLQHTLNIATTPIANFTPPNTSHAEPTPIQTQRTTTPIPTSAAEMTPPTTSKLEITSHERQPTSSHQKAWQNDYPLFDKWKHELCALCGYIQSRPKRFANKFTKATVTKNIINSDASLDKALFNQLVKMLVDKEYITKVKSSFTLTAAGQVLLGKIHQDQFQCV